MSQPSPRQVIYALVAGGLVLMVIVLTVGGAAAGVVPGWWSAAMALLVAIAATWIGQSWRRTGEVLAVGIGLFLIWMIGTLLTAG